MNHQKKILNVVFAVVMTSVGVSAHAVTQNGDLSVSANVVAICNVQGVAQSSQAQTFSPSSQAAQPAGNVAVNCSSGTTYSVALDAGVNPAAVRAIRGPANNIANGAQQNLPVYQRISSGQSGADDIVGVTLSY